MLLSHVAQIVNGRLIGKDTTFISVTTDSRKAAQGDLFIALQGKNFDGANFLGDVEKSGAVASMINANSFHNQENIAPLLLVENTQLALGKLAAHWRMQFDIPVVAITGSNGKTTVKEMLSSILRVAVGADGSILATEGNFNNEIGMPLTLLKMQTQHHFAVIEMGMNHFGEIDYLTRIAAPNIALINNASGAHLQGLGTVEAVAQAKGEIFSGLQDYGTAIINGDDAYASLWRTLAGANELLEFGLNPQADITGEWRPTELGLQLDAITPLGRFTANLQVPGQHNACNALAATAAAVALNISLDVIATGLESFKGVAGRLQRGVTKQGVVVIDDTYNANPASVRAALGVIEKMSGKRILVLGDMGELGEQAIMFHKEIGQEAKRLGVDKIFALGELSRHAVKGFGVGAKHFNGIEDLQEALSKEFEAGTVILIKGSRFMKMERVVQFCFANEATPCC